MLHAPASCPRAQRRLPGVPGVLVMVRAACGWSRRSVRSNLAGGSLTRRQLSRDPGAVSLARKRLLRYPGCQNSERSAGTARKQW